MASTYTIKQGDTLSGIAKQYGTTVDVLAKANNISNPNAIKAGAVLNIGSPAPAPAPVVTPTPAKAPVITPPKNIVPTISNAITNFDISNYRTDLSKLLGTPAPAPVVTPPNRNLVATPVASTPIIYPTPDGKAPVITSPTTTPTTGSYTAKAGDSLSKIASQNGMTLAQLLALNPSYKANPNLLKVGAVVNVTGGTPQNGGGSPQGGGTTIIPQDQKINAPVDPTKTNTDLAIEAGKAGLSLQEYQALLASKNGVTQEESDAIRKELGITGLEGVVFKKPSQTSQQIFDSAYATAGLAGVKASIDALNKEVAKDRADLAEAIGAVDENPFLTEKSRVGRGKRLMDQVEARINNKLSQIEAYQKIYDGGIKEINDKILRNQNDFNTNKAIDTAQLNYLVAKAEKEVATLAEKKKADSTTTIGAYLKARTSGKTPDVIGGQDTGYYKYDQATGKFIKIIAGAPKQTDSPTTFKPSAEQKSLVGRFMNSSAGAELGFTDADKTKALTDQNFFYWTLQKANEAGIY